MKSSLTCDICDLASASDSANSDKTYIDSNWNFDFELEW